MDVGGWLKVMITGIDYKRADGGISKRELKFCGHSEENNIAKKCLEGSSISPWF
jgi:hypothetical protein